MKKILITLYSTLLITSISAQDRMVLSDNIYLVIDDNANVVVGNSNTNAITVNNGGNIVSENENDVIKWMIGSNTGNFIIPFTTANNVKIPLEVNITTAGIGSGYINFATYETATDSNQLYPIPVLNMDGGCNGDNSLFAIDRFWRIEASNYSAKPTPVISFGYDDGANEMGGTNTIIEAKLKAERYNISINSWETPQITYGTANTVSNQIQNCVVNTSDFYAYWTLIDTTSILVIDSVTTSICQGDSILLGGAYQTTAGTYTDTLNYIAACDTVKITTLSIDICSAPQAGFTVSDSMVCETNCITFSDTSIGSTSWQWIFNGGTPASSSFQNPGVICYNTAGTYLVQQIVNNGTSSDTATFTINILQNPIINIAITDDNCFSSEGSLISSVSGGVPPYQYNWDNGSIDSSITGLEAGIYTLIVSDSNNCTTTNTATINDLSINCDYHIFLPNIFSPNGDGINDILFVRGVGIASFNLTVYSRWGEKVFETNDLKIGWDGNYKGKEMNAAVFVYYLTANMLDDEKIEKQGNITLVK
jgi:gliding motility-associated-like protein